MNLCVLCASVLKISKIQHRETENTKFHRVLPPILTIRKGQKKIRMMTNAQILTELYKIGKLPSDLDNASDEFPLDEFDELLKQISRPVTENEAIKLINLSPPVDTGCYGLEWTLLHLIETVDIEILQNVINNSEENELKKRIQIRLDNYNGYDK